MGIAVQWDNAEQTVIRWDFEQAWSWDEFADSARVSSAMIASKTIAVNVILNIVGTRSPYGKITTHHRSAFEYIPSNIGVLMLVCGEESHAAQLLMPFFSNLQIVETLAQAREQLNLQAA
ncbi:MAG: hypothetical protein IH587_05775 [Anaerolineae bacterium]|nr:hypothetical protein [Anaerolineae bacterium]